MLTSFQISQQIKKYHSLSCFSMDFSTRQAGQPSAAASPWGKGSGNNMLASTSYLADFSVEMRNFWATKSSLWQQQVTVIVA